MECSPVGSVTFWEVKQQDLHSKWQCPGECCRSEPPGVKLHRYVKLATQVIVCDEEGI